MEKTGIKRKLPNLAVEELKLVAGGQLPINAPPGWPTTAGSPNSRATIAAWLNALLVRYPARYNDIANFLQFVIPDFASFEFVPRGERGKQLRVQFEDTAPGTGGPPPLTLDFKKLSDGEKCFFLSALIMASNRPDTDAAKPSSNPDRPPQAETLPVTDSVPAAAG